MEKPEEKNLTNRRGHPIKFPDFIHSQKPVDGSDAHGDDGRRTALCPDELPQSAGIRRKTLTSGSMKPPTRSGSNPSVNDEPSIAGGLQEAPKPSHDAQGPVIEGRLTRAKLERTSDYKQAGERYLLSEQWRKTTQSRTGLAKTPQLRYTRGAATASRVFAAAARLRDTSYADGLMGGCRWQL